MLDSLGGKMHFIFMITVLFLGFAKGDWDLAVLSSSSLELLEQGPSERSLYSVHLGVKDISTFVYDPLLLHHYFAAYGHENASIFRIQVSRDGKFGPVEPLVKKQPDKIYGLAYDAESTSVFWTTESQILRSELVLGLSDAEIIHEFSAHENPLSIVVEPCTRYIYWSYRHGSIDRSLMDGSKKERIVDDLFSPTGLSISQSERMIYWADEGPGYSYRIGRSLLDGSNKEIILEGLNQQPLSLVVRPFGEHNSIVYWIDRIGNQLWRFEKNDTEPRSIHAFQDQTYAIDTANSFEHLDKHVCSRLILKRDQVPYFAISPTVGACVHGTYSPTSGSCVCSPGYTGTLCETSICYNYCLGGKCSLTNGKPYCRCNPGRAGLRCEVDRCRGYCLHGGCSLEGDSLSCTCHPGWYGPQCNYSELFCKFACSTGLDEQRSCNCNKTMEAAALTGSSDNASEYKIGFMVSSGICVLMLLCLVGLGVRNWRLGKRPRVKRFYKVTPNKGSAPQAVRTSPDCQIAIENCCNMNICETPCYEPELRPSGGKSKKEEKRGLLKEMEVQPDLSQTF